MATPPPLPPLPPPKPGSGRSTPQQPALATAPPPLPDTPFVAPGLKEKSVADLQYLLHSPSHLAALYNATHPAARQNAELLAASLAANIALAQKLAAAEQQLKTLRESTREKLAATRQLEAVWRQKEEEMYRSLKKFSSPDMQARLAQGVAEAGAEAEALERRLLEEGVPEGELGAWVKAYREVGKRRALRRERMGRWGEGRVGGWR